jgi:hypothetical protein
MISVAFAFVFISGLGQGLLTDRWGLNAEPQTSAAKLSELPLTLGDWRGEDSEMTPEEYSRAGIAGYVLRRYKHRLTGTELQVLLVCGRPGHVAVHSPEVCFQGEGYEFISQKRKYSSEDGDFWVASLVKDRGLPDQLRIFWSFGSAAMWTAPGDPRITFARKPVLFKLYVVRHLQDLNDPLQNDPSLDFLKILLPEIQKCLFST